MAEISAMNFFLVFPIALALAMDAFAVTVGVGIALKALKKMQAFRLAIYFGFFQFLMPLIGWQAGKSFLRYIREVDHWIAFLLLFFIGAKMIFESFRNPSEKTRTADDPTRGLPLIILSVATSIDAFAVGLSFAAIREEILYPSILIGCVAFLMTLLAAKVGPIIGKISGKGAELLGGLILCFMGIKILAEHLSVF
jgi:putative Mn2+ efflux pump MntP